MKTLKLTYKSLILLMALIAFPAMGQNFAEQFTYKGNYKVSEGMNMEVKNKYGNIHFANWDKDSILITTEVYLSSTSYKKLEKLKKSVNIKYTATKQLLLAETSFDGNPIQFIDDIQTFTGNLVSSNNKRIDINYMIYLPKDINVKVSNQYGDVFMENASGKVNITLSNGAFKANVLTGTTRFDFKYVQASIEKINDAEINLNYSKLDVSKAISLNCNSRSSELNIDDVGVLKLKSNRDEIKLAKVGYLYGSASYPKFTIDYLMNEIDCEMRYGNFTIDDIAQSCSMINLHTERTDIEIFIPKTRDFEYDLIYHPDCNMHLPIKAVSDTTTFNDEVMNTAQGKTSDSPSLSIRIKALKRSIVKMQYSLKGFV